MPFWEKAKSKKKKEIIKLLKVKMISFFVTNYRLMLRIAENKVSVKVSFAFLVLKKPL